MWVFKHFFVQILAAISNALITRQAEFADKECVIMKQHSVINENQFDFSDAHIDISLSHEESMG